LSTTVNQPDEATKELVRSETPRTLARANRSIKDLLEGPEFKAAVGAVLPRCLRADRFIRVALNALMRQPDLLQCTKESFFRAMLDLSSYGLEPDGRRAHLIPFNVKVKWVGEDNKPHERYEKQVQLIVDYKGLAELVRRSGDVSYIHADVVYENDEWDYGFGSGAFLKHKPNLEDRGKRRIAFYSFVKLKDGSEDFMVLSPREVDAVRTRSRAGNSGPWVSDYDEMGKKTAFRRHSKWLPLSAESRDAVEHDDEAIDTTGIDLAESMDGEDEPRTGTEKLKDKVARRVEEIRQESPQAAPPAAPPAPGPTTPAEQAPAQPAKPEAQGAPSEPKQAPVATDEIVKCPHCQVNVVASGMAAHQLLAHPDPAATQADAPDLFADKQPVAESERPLKTYGEAAGFAPLPDVFDVKAGLEVYFIEGGKKKRLQAEEDTWKLVSSEDYVPAPAPALAAPGPQAVPDPPATRQRRRNADAFNGGKA
jgi:recombination protein RecT